MERINWLKWIICWHHKRHVFGKFVHNNQIKYICLRCGKWTE